MSRSPRNGGEVPWPSGVSAVASRSDATLDTRRPVALLQGAVGKRPLNLPAVVGLGSLAAAAAAVVAPYDATLAVVAAVSLVAAGVAAVRVDVALLLLVGATPLEGGIIVAGNPQIGITKLAGALCFASFAVNAIATRRKLRFDRSHTIVLLLLLVSLVSTAQARETGAALATTFRYASFVALYFVVSQFVGDWLVLRRLAWVLSMSSAVAAAWALYRLVWLGSAQARLEFGNPNDLAFVLATTLPVTFWLLNNPWRYRLVAMLMIGVISAATVLTFSRGALVGLGAGVLWSLLVERRTIHVVLIGALVAGLTVWLFVRTNPAHVQAGYEQKQRVAAHNVETRLEGWAFALSLAEDHPVLGAGPGNFSVYYSEAAVSRPPSDRIGVVHNTYLDITAELGIGGLALFLAYLGMSFTRLAGACKRALGPPGYAAAVRTALVVACVAAITLSEQYFAPFWLLGALATALWAEDRFTTASAP